MFQGSDTEGPMLPIVIQAGHFQGPFLRTVFQKGSLQEQ